MRLEGKLQELIDRSEIWQVMQRYARGLDRIDREIVRSCYFDDAIEDHGKFVGKVDDFIDWALKNSLMFIECHHALMNHSCEIDGDDAHAETYYVFTGVLEKPPHLMTMGRYIDHFQRRDGEWRIANRVTLNEKLFGLSDFSFGADLPSAYGPKEALTGTRDRNDPSYHRPVRPRKPQPMRFWDP
jgi:SnoaL-like domain